ncbi:MAG: NHLP bacteriocin export ABC transporter permease/ATPase subunit [Lachnospiraceae bacterium]|nr:NHLP bacteriocin export ABC transporter permease/ATPase subunit [Lachnospiraceae bacterium]
MGWFDDQIRLRKKKDSDGYDFTLMKIAGAVTGKKKSPLSMDKERRESNAIEEILQYFQIRERSIPDKLKTLEARLDYALHPFGIMKREVELQAGWRRDAFGVMLGFLKEDGSPVALIPSGLSGYQFFDAAAGGYVRVNKNNEALFEKRAYAFYKPFPLKKLTILDLLKYIVSIRERADTVMILTVSLLVTLVGMLAPRINYFLFDQVIQANSMSLLVSAGIFLLCASVGALLLNAARSMISARIDTRMNLCVEAATMMRILSLPASFFKDYGSGELSSRASYVNSLCSTLVSVILNTGLTSLFSLAYITQIFTYAPGLVMPALSIILVTVLFSVVSSLLQMQLTRKMMLKSSKESGMSYAAISGIQKIKLSGAEKRAFSRWGDLYAEVAEFTYNPPLIIKLNGVISSAISIAGTIIMYHAALTTHVSVAEYYAFNTAYGMVSGAFMALSGMALSAANIRPIFEMAQPLLKTEPEMSEDKEILTSISGGVEISNLSFRYDEGSPMILDNISVKIKPGQYVAIVGKTGCGKSTLVRLLLGFEKPVRGGIYFDGRDLSAIDLKSLRKHIGVVTQNGKLFAGDIFSNIVVSAPALSLEEAWNAARIAGIDEDIRNMPMGMHTLISEGGGGISGGQKQRIMIARAVAPKPRLLIFDEATSALDNITQRKISEALDDMKCTRLVIAHRLSTIRQCDRILVLDQGHIVEDGTYEELKKKGGYFYELVKRQQVDFEDGQEVTQ